MVVVGVASLVVVVSFVEVFLVDVVFSELVLDTVTVTVFVIPSAEVKLASRSNAGVRIEKSIIVANSFNAIQVILEKI